LSRCRNRKEILTSVVVYFEIPVTELERAELFYSRVFEVHLAREEVDGNVMAHFPSTGRVSGISGSLAKGESYLPEDSGVRVYFGVESIDSILIRVANEGGKVAYPKTDVGDYGFVAEFIDSEGNRIGLNEPRSE